MEFKFKKCVGNELLPAKIEKKVNKKIKMRKNYANLSESRVYTSMQSVLLHFNGRSSI